MSPSRRSLEFRLLDQADKIRLVLVGYFVFALLTAPRDQVAHWMVAGGLVSLAALYAVFVHFVLSWHAVRREGQVHLMAALLVCTDLVFISLFVWAMGPRFLDLSMLLLLDVVFAAAFFKGFELPLVTGVVCGLLVLFNLSYPRPGAPWHATGAVVCAAVVIAWLAYALAEVARQERVTTDRIVRHLTEGILLVSADGELSVINPRSEHLFGVVASDVVGLNIHDPHNAQRLAPLLDALQDVPASAGEPCAINSRQLRIENPNPTDLQSVTVPCVADRGHPSAWIVVCKDITDLLSSVRVKEEGLAVLSHELRGRLHSVRASAEVLIRMADTLTPDLRSETLKLLDSETRRLTGLIGRMVEATTIEDETVPFEFRKTSVAQVAQEVCDGLRRNARTMGVELQLETAPGLPPALADPTRLDQAIYNLVENAIKFTPRGGTVLVSVTDDGDSVRVLVKDTGSGIPPDRRDAIFEKFTHGEAGTSAYLSGGLGLGLYICREIVRRHGGRIGCRSELGEGSEFFFTIPRMLPAMAPAYDPSQGQLSPAP